MTPREQLIESVTKASQCADMLAEDVRDAHRKSVHTEPVAELLVYDLIAIAQDIRNKLELLKLALKP